MHLRYEIIVNVSQHLEGIKIELYETFSIYAN